MEEIVMIVIKKRMKLPSWSVPGGATKNKEYQEIKRQITDALMPDPSTGRQGILFGVPDPQAGGNSDTGAAARAFFLNKAIRDQLLLFTEDRYKPLLEKILQDLCIILR